MSHGEPQLGSRSSKKNETVTRTLRLDNDIEEALVEMARKETTSVNVVANRALRDYVEWGAQAANFGFMSFSGTMMTRMMNLLSEDEVREMGRWTAKNLAMETAQYWFKKVDFDTAIATLERLGTYGKRFRFDHSSNRNHHTLVLKHDMGIKWSLYYEEAVLDWFKEIIGEQILDLKAESTENQVTILVDLKTEHTLRAER